MVLQVDYQELFTSYRIQSGDLIFRRYLVDPDRSGMLPFLGPGIGVSEVTFALDDDRGQENYWSLLAEFGVEMRLGNSLLLLGRGQYRLYDHNGHDYTNWSARVGLGTALPW